MRDCARCGKTFRPWRTNTKMCSPECRYPERLPKNRTERNAEIRKRRAELRLIGQKCQLNWGECRQCKKEWLRPRFSYRWRCDACLACQFCGKPKGGGRGPRCMECYLKAIRDDGKRRIRVRGQSKVLTRCLVCRRFGTGKMFCSQRCQMRARQRHPLALYPESVPLQCEVCLSKFWTLYPAFFQKNGEMYCSLKCRELRWIWRKRTFGALALSEIPEPLKWLAITYNELNRERKTQWKARLLPTSTTFARS